MITKELNEKMLQEWKKLAEVTNNITSLVLQIDNPNLMILFGKAQGALADFCEEMNVLTQRLERDH